MRLIIIAFSIIGSVLITTVITACGGGSGISEQTDHQAITVGTVLPLSALNHPFDDVIVDGETKFTAIWSVGSAAYRHANDANNVFYVIGDSAVSIRCKDSFEILGKLICPINTSGKILPFLDSTTSIVKYKINDDETSVTVIEVITLKDSNGIAIIGLLNPVMKTDGKPGFTISGEEIEYDANALDSEALIKLTDGSFWIADEFAASLSHVSSDGRIIKRLIPAGFESEYQDVAYPVEASLPAILTKRHVNRGIESLAVNPGETHLYFIMQRPLDNPDSDAYKISANIRLYKMNITDPSDIEEYLYVLEKPETFIKDNALKTRAQKDVKISEMRALDDNRMMILEHISASTKIFTVDMDSSMILTAAQSENLELNTAGINPVTKNKVFDTDFVDGFPDKIEGMANLGNGKFLLINDNDFAVEGANTKAIIVPIDVN